MSNTLNYKQMEQYPRFMLSKNINKMIYCIIVNILLEQGV